MRVESYGYASLSGNPDYSLVKYSLVCENYRMLRLKPILLNAIFWAGISLAAALGPITENTEKEKIRVVPVVEGLNYPWSIAFLPDDRILLTERTGALKLLDRGRLLSIKGVPDSAFVGQGGMLDIALSPFFSQDSLVYFSFAEADSNSYGTSVARGKLTGLNTASPRLDDLKTIYQTLPRKSGGLHFGSRLAFDRDGHLYVTLGERGDMNLAQDPFTPMGTVLRLNPDGTIPNDNPFAPGGTSPGKGKPEIWTWGHRNPQGMAINPATGEVWVHEHGPKGGDEVNRLVPGGNYGWPKLTYGINYDGSIITNQQSAPGFVDSLIHWTPSIAPSGMAFYTGNLFPRWKGNLFAGALAGKQLRRLELNGNTIIHQEVLLYQKMGRIRDVRMGPDGKLYLLTDAKKGGLYRIEPLE